MAKPRIVLGIFISPEAATVMHSVEQVRAIAGRGLEGDRYSKGKDGKGEGSFNSKKGGLGTRQVSLINAAAFEGTIFEWSDSYRNIITQGVELNRIGNSEKKEFEIGDVRLRYVKYCFPCKIPSERSGKPGFDHAFEERGGIIAEVLTDGIIRVGDPITVHY